MRSITTELPSYLTAAEKYLAEVDREPHALMAVERSQQTQNRINSKQDQRLLRSNVLIFREGAESVWFRDVIEVNGSKVVTEPDRLMALVNASVAPSRTMLVQTPLQIVTESARQQYGGSFRVINQPGAALGYVRTGRREGLTFRSEGWKTVNGAKVVVLSLKDAQRRPGRSKVAIDPAAFAIRR